MLDRQTVNTLATAEDVSALNISSAVLSDDAIALLGYQRTKQISAKARKSWEAGNPAPLRQEARERREEIFNGALLECYSEYLPLSDYMQKHGIAPASLLDIGCGQAIPTLFLQRDFAPDITLVDIEQTDDQYHAWANSGAGYASLADATAMLRDNGTGPITAINPRTDPGALTGLRADLVTSFYSCGFHYPVDDYADLMIQTVQDGGTVCLDLRKRYLRWRKPALVAVLEAGRMEVLYDDARSQRVVIRKE